MVRKQKWFSPGKVNTGWDKNDPPTIRRRKALKAHKTYLSAGRAMQALSNVTQDKRTAALAGQDARYFFRLNKEARK